MTSLNVSNNNLGVAAGWTFSSDEWWLNGEYPPGHSDSHPCNRLPIAGSDASGVILLADAIKNNGALQCTDGTPYQSEKSFMMSTHVCRHCGQHKTQHTSR
jgi:hypothetical protein